MQLKFQNTQFEKKGKYVLCIQKDPLCECHTHD